MKNINITPQILMQIAELDEFKGAWTGIARLRTEQLKALKNVSLMKFIRSSQKEEETAGYADLMNIILYNYPVIPFTEDYIKELHQILFQFSGRDEGHSGEYKKIPDDTPRLMEDLIKWTRKNLDDPFFHPLIVIGVFAGHFLGIHPFQDGNGRLSQALTTMLLLKKGYSFILYGSIESIIEANKEGYNRALYQTADYEPWLSYFLTILQQHKRQLESKIEAMANDDTQLSRNQKTILKLFDNKPDWSASEIAAELGMSIETTKKIIKALMDSGYLIKYGTTKGAWYGVGGRE